MAGDNVELLACRTDKTNWTSADDEAVIAIMELSSIDNYSIGYTSARTLADLRERKQPVGNDVFWLSINSIPDKGEFRSKISQNYQILDWEASA